MSLGTPTPLELLLPRIAQSSLNYSSNKHFLTWSCTEASKTQSSSSRSSSCQGGSQGDGPLMAVPGNPARALLGTHVYSMPLHCPGPTLSLPRPHLSPSPPGTPKGEAAPVRGRFRPLITCNHCENKCPLGVRLTLQFTKPSSLISSWGPLHSPGREAGLVVPILQVEPLRPQKRTCPRHAGGRTGSAHQRSGTRSPHLMLRAGEGRRGHPRAWPWWPSPPWALKGAQHAPQCDPCCSPARQPRGTLRLREAMHPPQVT